MNQQPLDLSVLDPSRDEARWQQLIRSIAQQACARRRVTIGRQMVDWARPVVVAVAAVALVCWVGAVVARRPRATSGTTEHPALVVASWAVSDEVPPTTTILEVLGDDDGRP